MPNAKEVLDVLDSLGGTSNSEASEIRAAISSLAEKGKVRPSVADNLATAVVYAQDQIRGVSSATSFKGGSEGLQERFFEGPEEARAGLRPKFSSRKQLRAEYRSALPAEYRDLMRKVFTSKRGRNLATRGFEKRIEIGESPDNVRAGERLATLRSAARFGGRVREPGTKPDAPKPGIAGLRALFINPRQRGEVAGLRVTRGGKEISTIKPVANPSPRSVSEAMKPVPEAPRLPGRVENAPLDRLRATANDPKQPKQVRLMARKLARVISERQAAEAGRFGKRAAAVGEASAMSRGPRIKRSIKETKPEMIGGKMRSRKVAVIAPPESDFQARKREKLESIELEESFGGPRIRGSRRVLTEPGIQGEAGKKERIVGPLRTARAAAAPRPTAYATPERNDIPLKRPRAKKRLSKRTGVAGEGSEAIRMLMRLEGARVPTYESEPKDFRADTKKFSETMDRRRRARALTAMMVAARAKGKTAAEQMRGIVRRKKS